MFLPSKIFMTAWLGFALLLTVFEVATALQAVVQNQAQLENERMALLSPLIGVLFCLTGVALVRGCWWWSQRDMAYLTSVIQTALRERASNSQ